MKKLVILLCLLSSAAVATQRGPSSIKEQSESITEKLLAITGPADREAIGSDGVHCQFARKGNGLVVTRLIDLLNFKDLFKSAKNVDLILGYFKNSIETICKNEQIDTMGERDLEIYLNSKRLYNEILIYLRGEVLELDLLEETKEKMQETISRHLYNLN
jgi:hypothetical protein